MSKVVLIGGPSDGRRIDLTENPMPAHVCTRVGGGPWHHYEQGEFDSYWHAGLCEHDRTEEAA
jgi:hypothetical protein